ncbi:carbon monoxide dehydrogenase subunit G [Nocardioides sp. SLBN-35]|nr:carbon monoxide dehydrogenase subunit G [Nocardioides sp. SLBN-35]
MMSRMRYSRELAYDAPPEEVFAMLADPAFREKVGAAQDVVSIDVTLTPAGAGFTLVSDQVQNTAGLPAIAKKIAGDTTQAVVRESWNDATSGTIEITAPGKPTRATGTIRLSAAGGGTSYVQDLDVVVKVPLIAGKLEKLMADNIDAGLTTEHAVGVAWLKGER